MRNNSSFKVFKEKNTENIIRLFEQEDGSVDIDLVDEDGDTNYTIARLYKGKLKLQPHLESTNLDTDEDGYIKIEKE